MLAHALKCDRNAVICDFAEYYHIYEIEPLPASRVAAFFVGLPNKSRIKMKLRGQNYSDELLMGALILDALNMISWQLGGNKSNRPASVYELMTDGEPRKKVMGFNSGAEFDAYRNEILERIKENG